ncbi:outer membrane beta-barrel protein [Bradyrhizobium sp. 62B]|uniref:outer membrane protein n=1 Tax=Bradyrhizobium TaxID=374 RepID=UPI00216818DB|nr:outer membrane beta-barrel protein [Bradyrhizobium centrosematis]MCS3759412.1 outer membrane immunogenic protein [Bradyrhizobium centrosematis]MCS3772698.1 outer membrane immunogenic protein [Bradyrhizobium centrosematis]WIW43280.1 outer membrane beta-barrel protein [Bradyrhizobium sp. 62B]
MRTKLIAAFACTTALVSTGAASAADLGARYTKAPAYAEPLFNWTGFYVGGHIGGAWTNEQFINNGTGAPFGDLSVGDSFRQRKSGIMGGAQIGYNWQANNYVFGMEGTISGLDNKGSFTNNVFGIGLDDQFSWRANVLATIVGRAGFAVQNNLFYIKGGYAGVNNRLSVVDNVANPSTGSGGQTHWHNGWTVGAGWEYGITRNWIVGLEYNYAAFGSQTYQLGGTSGNYTFDTKPRDIQWAVVRASYKFDAPTIARY